MNIRIVTDRRVFWNAALGHRDDVEAGGNLGDPWGKQTVLIVDLRHIAKPDRIAEWVGQASPVAVLVVAPMSEPHHSLMEALGHAFPAAMVETLAAERYGSLTVWHGSVAVFSHRLETFPPATHGPGVRDVEGRPVFWDRVEEWTDFGTPVSRDEPAVIASLYRSTTGRQPLWMQPGFPVVIPSQPQSYPTLSGGRAVGVLCAAQDPRRIGGWDVLELGDMARLLGYPPEFFSGWSELTNVLPAAGARALVQWAFLFNPLVPSP